LAANVKQKMIIVEERGKRKKEPKKKWKKPATKEGLEGVGVRENA